jgi:AraC-like DNA-binding protein
LTQLERLAKVKNETKIPFEEIWVVMEDEEHACDGAAVVLGPHTLRIDSLRTRPDMRMSVTHGAAMIAATLAYRCEVSIDLAVPRPSYLVLIVLRGRAVCRHGNIYLDAGPGSVLAAAPDQALIFSGSYDCVFRAVRIEPSLMHARMAPLLQVPEGEPIAFGPSQTTVHGADDPVTKSVLRFLTVRSGDRLTRFSEEIFVDWLLRHQPHRYSGELRLGGRSHVEEAVPFVKVLMHADPFGGRAMSYYAQQAGVSLSELTAAFQGQLGCLPHQYLRGVRLNCVRWLLTAARPGSVTVRSIAVRCGFRDNMQFHRWYFERFREWPTATLRRK